MKTLYISGPITDPSTGQPREGWQKDFLDAEATLRSKGFYVINPVDIAREVDEKNIFQWEYFPHPCTCTGEPIPPSRAEYVLACLQRMNMNKSFDRLHGLYLIGKDVSAKQGIYFSHGVTMELHMAVVLEIPIFAEFYGGSEIDIHLLPVKDGLHLTDKGEFEK
jgi:hypothetical protein